MIEEDEEQHDSGIIRWFINNPVAANLLMAAIILCGMLSLATITRSLNPDIEPNKINITIAYPGAAPEEVERSVTIKIEERIKEIEGISRFFSTSDESLSTITIDISDGYNNLEVLDQVQSRVDSIKTFPEEIEKPVINRQQIRRQAMMIQVYGDMDELGMKTLAEELKLEMQQNPIFTSIDILGARPYEVSIEIPELLLRKHQLSITQVVAAINASSVDVPGGSIKTERGSIMLRTTGQAYDQYDFERIALKSFSDGSQILLGDIANIQDGFAEVDGFARFNGKPSVALAIYAAGEQDILKVAEAAQAFVDSKQSELPDNVSLVTWADVTFYLKDRLNMMSSNMLMGALLVFIILSVFLEIKVAFWVMLGLPVCFLGAFALMPLEPFNVTMNMVSLFGFLLVLGIAVDDAIIIGESIHTQTNEYGDTIENVAKGANAVAVPATFGVLTTIAAFAPTVFVTGPYSALPQAIGYVVIFCLMFSLIESKWILPAHLGQMARKAGGYQRKPSWISRRLSAVQHGCDDAISFFTELKYRPFLKKALDARYVTLASFIALLIITIGMFTSGVVRLSVVPDIPSDFLIAKIEMREGASDRQMREGLAAIESAVLEIEQEYLNEYQSDIGLIQHRIVLSDSDKMGLAMLELVKSVDRKINSNEIVHRWREKVGDIAGAKLINFSSVEDAGGPPLAFKIIGRDMDQLTDAANLLEQRLQTYEGVFDIENGSSDINDEVNVSLKKSAMSLGINLVDLGTQVRQAFYGAEAQRIQRGNDEIKVMVRFPKDERTLANLENMEVNLPNGTAVPFSAVADIELRRSLAKNTRINGEKAVTVAARVDKGQTQPSKISDDIMKHFAVEIEDQFPGIKLKLDGASIEAQAMITKIFISFILALIAIYVLLAVPLKSYSQPLIIMMAIPFGIVGAVFGHVVMNVSVNMLSFFGMIALAGVVVNDSLVLVDFINKSRQKGLRLQSAILDAGVKRFRAVFITSLTTFAGLLPMLFESSLQAQLVIPMAISMSFGIVFATAITLVLIPCLYQVIDDISQSMSASKKKSIRFNNPELILDE